MILRTSLFLLIGFVQVELGFFYSLWFKGINILIFIFIFFGFRWVAVLDFYVETKIQLRELTFFMINY